MVHHPTTGLWGCRKRRNWDSPTAAMWKRSSHATTSDVFAPSAAARTRLLDGRHLCLGILQKVARHRQHLRTVAIFEYF